MKKIFIIIITSLLCGITFVCSAEDVKFKSTSFQYYEPIEDQAALQFINDGLSYAKQLLGEPKLKVNYVYLRRSTPIDPNSQLKRDFQLCEITDSDKGIFTIYLSHYPNEYAFYGQLGHEIAHLLNDQLSDAYVEGLNTVFAERLSAKYGKDWSGWVPYLEHDDLFYGSTYAMMKQVWDAVGDKGVKSFLSFAVYSDSGQQKMHIDIDRYLTSLSPDLSSKVRRIIAEHETKVNYAVKLNGDSTTFLLPTNISAPVSDQSPTPTPVSQNPSSSDNDSGGGCFIKAVFR